MRIVLDTRKCVGYGECVALAPELFDFDDGTGRCLRTEVPPGSEETARRAVARCPTRAIEAA